MYNFHILVVMLQLPLTLQIMEDTTRGADDTVNLDNTVDVDPNDVTVDVTKEETESNVKNQSTGQSADMSGNAAKLSSLS